MKKNIIRVIVASIITLTFTTLIKAEDTKEQAAIRAAENWLFIIDTEQYEDSWENGAIFLKTEASKELWVSSMNKFRKPLGKMEERKFKSSQYMINIPDAPDGEYVVIQFDTVFENKKEAIETITPMLDPDGEWRVAGYFIK